MASNFNGSTPAAPTGSLNVVWATDGAGNDSASYASPTDIAVTAPGIGTNNQVLIRFKLNRAVTFPANAPLSHANASANATGNTTYTFKKNGSSFATVLYSTGGATGAFTQASNSTFAAGDLLELDGPATADATLADVGINLAGYRT